MSYAEVSPKFSTHIGIGRERPTFTDRGLNHWRDLVYEIKSSFQLPAQSIVDQALVKVMDYLPR